VPSCPVWRASRAPQILIQLNFASNTVEFFAPQHDFSIEKLGVLVPAQVPHDGLSALSKLNRKLPVSTRSGHRREVRFAPKAAVPEMERRTVESTTHAAGTSRSDCLTYALIDLNKLKRYWSG
jgi:hypothetical protein